MFDLIKSMKSVAEVFKRKNEYLEMSKDIESNLPMLYEAFGHFGKTQSQFMDNFLTVSHPTPLRNARQCLAEINKSVQALREAQYQLSKKQLLIKRLERDLAQESDILKKAEIQLEIDYESSNLHGSKIYIEGAIRAVKNYTDQYKSILKKFGVDEMTEKDFEREEEKYHIMKAFEQALCAARSHGGLVDEGNHIYFSQIGVNGGMAQNFITKFLEQEKQAIEAGGILTSQFQTDFLEEMAVYFRTCSKVVAEIKGILPVNSAAILKEESNLYQIREAQ